MGLFSFIGGILGGGSAKKAVDKAAKAQEAALNRAIDIQNQQYQQTRQDFMPYTQAGTNAITSLDALMKVAMGGGYGGAGGWGTPPTVATDEMLAAQAQLEGLIKGTPLYQATYRNGEEALLQNASATGGLRGGDTARGLADFGADTLANVYGTIKNDLGGLAGLGLGATGSVAGFGANAANATAGLTSDIGQVQAAKYLTKGGINSQMWNNAGSFLDSAVSAGLPGGGGGFSFSKALKSIF